MPGGPFCCSRNRATHLLLLMMNGLTIIDSAIATSSGWPSWVGSASPCRTSVSSAIPNSPAIEITTPVRMALNHEPVNHRRHERRGRRLEHDEPEQHGEHEPELVHQQPHVEQHAHGDEEQAQQDVAERPDHDLDLMPVLGFREHHPRQEAAQRQRQAGAMRHPRRREHDEQHGRA